MLTGAKACTSCRSRQELSNEYLLAKIGLDTAENDVFARLRVVLAAEPRAANKVRQQSRVLGCLGSVSDGDSGR